MSERRVIVISDELYHEGVKGMEHGKRRYQYKDGSLTPEGYIHYGVNKPTGSKKEERRISRKEQKEKKYVDEKGNLTDAGKMKYLRTKERVGYVEKRLGKKSLFDYRSAGALRGGTIGTMIGLPKNVITAVVTSSLGAIGGTIMYQIDKNTVSKGRAFMEKIEKQYGYTGQPDYERG